MRATTLLLAGCLLGSWPAAALPIKNGQLPTEILPQTRARPALDLQRLYFGMREEDFAAYARDQTWMVLEASARVQRKAATAIMFSPGGEAVDQSGGPPVFAQGFFVRAYFERGRLVGLQLLPNYSEGGISLTALQRLSRSWFPDEKLNLRFQMFPEDGSQQVVEAILGRVPDSFADQVGRAHLQFQSLVLGP
ncbi:hypothetical protein [Gloeobacter kilaueensis]|uniref:Uncharacterized protein n=1 Tax=Gloeobacter kilaueensis (strain ATCC BAA-2537 / CCAP 1431/1 / ULC 316 / JS1) TaxID=1183438 RepID=U5QGY3_GLOK1|nr:hypothetical protein [Gloeobacter kilaueensis]AGY58237.1 hypothetical protein GKIL_1991 [Gloeobacter kilaueensis JS1]